MLCMARQATGTFDRKDHKSRVWRLYHQVDLHTCRPRKNYLRFGKEYFTRSTVASRIGRKFTASES